MTRRFLLITPAMPEPGSGAGQRTTAIHRAMSRLGEVRILYLKFPRAMSDGSKADHVLDVIPDGTSETWFWRRRRLALREFSTDRRVAAFVGDLYRRERFDGFFCRYHVATWGGADRLGPALCDLDDLPIEPRQARWGLDGLRRRAFARSLCGYRTVFVTKLLDVPFVAHRDVRVLPCTTTLTGSGGVAREERVRVSTMLFVGPRGHHPNRAGVDRFVRECLPRIRASVPDAVLRIAGSGWEALAGTAGVEVRGFVSDLAAEYALAAIVVCPVWDGTGACVKLAEAASFGKAVVASGHAARGYEGILVPGRDLLAADESPAVADACVRLLTDAGLRREVGANARGAAARGLGQDAIDRLLAEAFDGRASS